MNPLLSCKPYIFRAQGDADSLPYGPAYCFEIIANGERSYHLATRNMDGEDLMKRAYPDKGYENSPLYDDRQFD
ncbi:hypothetical protein [Paraburkholderia acidisoli]|uniref:Uncharacterized protein n=1 Tax=Paraburkholderia acidisoli TaxID=2571748 RepID=A0A7Z2GQZ0_9BURK|nr:hypothetical protein [Paraburkholderia acidisoli]QGZ66282.1 hypothetical protein FAZ98_31275 [Paraburkholderia acidisoli]